MTTKHHCNLIQPNFLLLLFGFLLSFHSGFAQTGDYLLTHYEPESRDLDNQNFDISQDKLGQICFANRKGVLKFDGSIWYLVNTPSSAHALKYDSLSGYMYVGCTEDFGYIHPDETGKEKYYSLSSGLPFFGDVLEIETISNKAYFLTEKTLFEYSIERKEITKFWNNIGGNHIYNIAQHNGKILIFTENQKLFLLENGIPNATTFAVPDGTYGVFLTKKTDNNYLLGTSGGRIYNFNGSTFQPLNLEDSTYIKEAELVNAHLLNSGKLFIATMKGGALIINLSNGKTENFINYHTGLPDDEIQAVFPDKSGGVWIAHEFGLSRLDYQLPFRCFSNYPGLEGNIHSAITYNDKLHVATSTGVYVLDLIKSYQEVETVVRVKRKSNTASRNTPAAEPDDLTNQQSQNKKLANIQQRESKAEDQPSEKEEIATESPKAGKKVKKFFKNLFGKKKSEDEPEESPSDEDPQTDNAIAETKKEPDVTKDSEEQKDTKIGGFLKKIFKSEDKKKQEEEAIQKQNEKIQREKGGGLPEYYYVTKKELSLQSVKYAFKKIKGIDAKCEQLILFDEKLLVATNYGVFEIDEEQNVNSINRYPVIHLYKSPNYNRFYASALGNRLLAYSYTESKTWEVDPTFEEVDFYVSNLLEDRKGDLWLTSNKTIYRVDLNESGGIDGVKALAISNPYSDNIAMVNVQDRMYFALSEGIYYHNDSTGVLEKDPNLETELGFKGIYLNSQENLLWVFNGKSWDYLSEKVTKNENFAYLKIFKNIEDIHLSKNRRSFWVITENAKLYKFDFLESTELLHNSEVFLRHIRNKEGELLTLNDLKVEEKNSKLSFIFSNPDYLNIQNLEYRYKLKGSSTGKDWSNWTNENLLSFNYLPAGKYILELEARNSFGETSAAKPFPFTVTPPYWQTPWFYGIEVGFFGVLLLLSFRLNRGKTRNLVISKGLTYFTLILIVAFIETVVQSFIALPNNPVFDFASQALLAIGIFPFERFLTSFVQGMKR